MIPDMIISSRCIFPITSWKFLTTTRLVADLNGLDTDLFLQELESSFFVEKTGNQPVRPKQHNEDGHVPGR